MKHRYHAFLDRTGLTCRGTMGLISESLDRPLTRWERLGVGIHLLHCIACRRGRSQVKTLVRLLRDAARRGDPGRLPQLPEDVRDRIRRSIRDD